MNRKELMREYWRYYKTLECKLIETVSYVEFHRENFSTFSNEYALLLQAIGAELDNFFKIYCGYNQEDRKNIKDYAKSILNSYPNIVNQVIRIREFDIELQPFAGWNVNAPAKSLSWWFAFDCIKHNRVGNVKMANQLNVLNILAALFLLETKYLGFIVEKDSFGNLLEPDAPDENSRLFEIKGWHYRYIKLNDAFAIVKR